MYIQPFHAIGPMCEIMLEEHSYDTSHETGFYSIIQIRIMLSSPTLCSLAGFSSLAECLPRGASSQSALHVSIDNSQTINVAGINPAKT